MLPLQGAWVQSLVWELRSHMPGSVAKNIFLKICLFQLHSLALPPCSGLGHEITLRLTCVLLVGQLTDEAVA